MKKTLSTVALSTVLVLGMAASALATHGTQPAEMAVSSAGAAKITLDGAIRERGRMQKTDAVKDTSSSSFYDGRIRLGIKAQAEHVTGYVQFESQQDASTNNSQSDTYTWGKNYSGSAGYLFNGGQKHNAMEVLQAWIQYQPSNWGVKVGHMPLALGNKVFFDHTGYGDDAVMAYSAFGATHVAGILIKFNENSTNDSTDDLDGYVGLATHQFSDNFDGGVNWTYLRGGSSDSISTTTTYEGTGTPTTTYDAAGNPTTTYPTRTQTGTINNYENNWPGLSMSNIGINANYRQNNLSFLADAEFQLGRFSKNATTTVDARGWAVKLGANMDLGAAKVGLLYGYGTGDGSAGSANHTFFTFLSNTNYDTIIAGYLVQRPGTFTKHSGLSNLSEYQVNASTKTTCPITGKPLALMASATYMKVNNTDSFASYQNDKIGTELDTVATWTLAPGLIYKVEAAYMFTGNAWNTAATGSGSDPDNLYFLRHRLEFTF